MASHHHPRPIRTAARLAVAVLLASTVFGRGPSECRWRSRACCLRAAPREGATTMEYFRAADAVRDASKSATGRTATRLDTASKAGEARFDGKMLNAAHAAIDGGEWVIDVAKRKVPPNGTCVAAYELTLRLRPCGGGESTGAVVIGPASPDRDCFDARGWRSSGPEDARLLALPAHPDVGARFWLVYADFVPRVGAPGGYSKHMFGAVVSSTGRAGSRNTFSNLEVQAPKPLDWADGSSPWSAQEKNWSPFLSKGQTYVHQWLAEPFTGSTVALEVDASSSRISKRHVCPGSGARLRRILKVDDGTAVAGGTNGLALNASHSIAVGHTFIEAPNALRMYAQFAYLFSSAAPFCIVAATRRFHLSVATTTVSRLTADFAPLPTTAHTAPHVGNAAIQFPTSLVAVDGGALQLAWGRGDRASHLSTLDAKWIVQQMALT